MSDLEIRRIRVLFSRYASILLIMALGQVTAPAQAVKGEAELSDVASRITNLLLSREEADRTAALAELERIDRNDVLAVIAALRDRVLAVAAPPTGMSGDAPEVAEVPVTAPAESAPDSSDSSAAPAAPAAFRIDAQLLGEGQNLLGGLALALVPERSVSSAATTLEPEVAGALATLLQHLPKVRIEASAQAVVAAGEMLKLGNVEEFDYISDYVVSQTAKEFSPTPIIKTLQDGIMIEITPTVASDGAHLEMTIELIKSKLKRPIERIRTSLGAGPEVVIDLPELEVMRSITSTRLDRQAGGAFMVVAKWGRGELDSYMFVTVTPESPPIQSKR